MSEPSVTPITRDTLVRKLERGHPDNDDPSAGFALVNVLGEDQFERERIPGSANIPQGQEEVFERRFEKGKEIVVYCASPECEASSKVARELARRGFEHVQDYEGGMSDWRDSGRAVAGTGV
jgi:rhodanese-related sulfurtransferase